jgi:ABC-type transport system involved in multi-copper enzyme maturation permease subunit
LATAAATDYTTLYALVGVAIVFGLATVVLGTRGRIRSMNIKGVWGILSFTYREAIRTKWLIIFGIIFFLLAVNIPNLYLAATAGLAEDYLPQNMGDLLSITFPLIPLLALPVGAVTIVEERESGTLQYLLSNPVTKSEFYLGKTVGLLFATTTVIIIGFGAASAVVYTTGVSNYYPIIMIMLFAALLNAVMLGIALIISEFSKRKATAMGIGIMVWFLLSVVSALDQLVIAINLRFGPNVAAAVVLMDPVETARELTVYGAGLGNAQMTNAAFLLSFVWKSNAYLFTMVSVLSWIAITFMIGFFIFSRQDAA